ncbi:MAG TPA: hypothetical protein VLF62_05470 [Candidatus Saccharimonadales bacterium]|nr:hypothetical protein [Candidatus Saccharimonadales bacterium]
MSELLDTELAKRRAQETALIAHRLIERTVRFEPGSNFRRFTEDELDTITTLQEAGPYPVAVDPNGKPGSWSVHLRRRLTVDYPSPDQGWQTQSYATIVMDVVDMSACDPTDPTTTGVPLFAGELVEYLQQCDNHGEPPRCDALLPPDVSQAEANMAYQEQVLCIGWLSLALTGQPAATT